jgi:hypothetical protein
MRWILWSDTTNGKWIYLAKDRDQWRDVVNTVMNLRVLLNAGNFLTR